MQQVANRLSWRRFVLSEEYPDFIPIGNTRVLLRTGQWLCDPSTGAIQRVGETNGRAPRAQCPTVANSLPPQASPVVCSCRFGKYDPAYPSEVRTGSLPSRSSHRQLRTCRQREPRTRRCHSEAKYRASASKSVSQNGEPQRELLPKVFGTTVCVCASNALEVQRNCRRNSSKSSSAAGAAAGADRPRREGDSCTRPVSVANPVLCRALPEAPDGLL